MAGTRCFLRKSARVFFIIRDHKLPPLIMIWFLRSRQKILIGVNGEIFIATWFQLLVYSLVFCIFLTSLSRSSWLKTAVCSILCTFFILFWGKGQHWKLSVCTCKCNEFASVGVKSVSLFNLELVVLDSYLHVYGPPWKLRLTIFVTNVHLFKKCFSFLSGFLAWKFK